MDDRRRGQLRDALNMLSNAASVVERVCDKEQDCVDNYPENLQSTERFEKMEDALDRLNDALEKIEEKPHSVCYPVKKKQGVIALLFYSSNK